VVSFIGGLLGWKTTVVVAWAGPAAVVG